MVRMPRILAQLDSEYVALIAVKKRSGNRSCSAAAKGFKLPANIFTRKRGTNVFIIEQNLWQNNLNF